MRNYAFAGASRVRVWMDEPLPASYVGNELRRRVDAVARFAGASRAVAVEARIPAGAVVRYGLLGAHFVPTDGTALEVNVLVSTEEMPFETPLAIAPERVLLGLTGSYAEAVADVLVADAPHRLGGGTMHVSWAAHGQIGSSPALFASIARVLVDLLAGSALLDETITTCLSERLDLRL